MTVFHLHYSLRAFRLALVFLTLSFVAIGTADEPTDDSAKKSVAGELPPELLTRAKELLASWDRPAPKLEVTEKWRVSLPVGEFAPVAWATDSDRMAVLTRDQEVLVLDATDGHELARYKGKAEDRPDNQKDKEGNIKGQGLPQCIAISPDGKHVAIGCIKGTLMWNWADDKIECVHGDSDGVKEIHISADGKWIFLALEKHRFCTYPLFTGEGTYWTYPAPSGIGPSGLAISPDGQSLLCRLSRARRFFEIRMENGKVVANSLWAGHEDTLCMAAGKTLRASGNREGDLMVYEAMRDPAAEKRPAWNSVETSVHFLRHVSISRDEQYVMGTTGVRDLVVRLSDGNHANWMGSIPDGRLRTVQSDLSAVIAATAKGELIRYDIAPLAAHPARELELHVRGLLERKEYDELDALFEAAVGSDSFAFAPMHTRFARMAHEFNTLPTHEEVRKRIQPRATEWLDTHVSRAGAAYIVASRKVAEGWQARGSGFAFTVTAEGYEKFHKELMGAHEILDPIINGNRPVPIEIYQVWFQIGTGAGWSPAVLRANIAQYLEKIDGYDSAMDVIGVMLLPRWYGEYPDAHEFAKRVRDKLGQDPGKIAYARIAAHLFRYHANDVWVQNHRQQDDTTPNLGFDLPETREGLLLALKRNDCSEEFLKVVQGIAALYSDDELSTAVFRRRDKNARGEP